LYFILFITLKKKKSKQQQKETIKKKKSLLDLKMISYWQPWQDFQWDNEKFPMGP